MPVPSREGVSGSPGLGPRQRGFPVPSAEGPPGEYLDVDAASNDTEMGDVEPSDLVRAPTEPGTVLPAELLEASQEAPASGGAGWPEGGARSAGMASPVRAPTEPGSALPAELREASQAATAGGGAGWPEGGSGSAGAGLPNGGAQSERDEDEWA